MRSSPRGMLSQKRRGDRRSGVSAAFSPDGDIVAAFADKTARFLILHGAKMRASRTTALLCQWR